MVEQVWGMDCVKVWFDGTFTEPRLNHPEGIWVDKQGNVWCGGEEGEIYKILADGSHIELVARTNGFGLGITMDSQNRLYLCDMYFACVFRYDPVTKQLQKFSQEAGVNKLNCPNYAVVDEARGRLYVSDTQAIGPGVWCFDLETGKGDLWYSGNCIFANGMALSADGRQLYLVESDADSVSKISIQDDGCAGEKVHVVTIPGTTPDGLALDRHGQLYISCYEPSAIYRYTSSGKLELLVHDTRCVTLAHPTNIAFRGERELFCSSLGRWHISVIQIPE